MCIRDRRRCAWWCSLKGHPEVENKERVVIDIPLDQQLTPEVLVQDVYKRQPVHGIELSGPAFFRLSEVTLHFQMCIRDSS